MQNKGTALAVILAVIICVGIVAIVLEQRHVAQESSQTRSAEAMPFDYQALPGTWNGTWTGPHHGTITFTFDPTGAYTCTVTGIDVNEHGKMSGNSDQAGNLSGTYDSPTIGKNSVVGQLYSASDHQMTGYIDLYSAPKMEKAAVSIALAKAS